MRINTALHVECKSQVQIIRDKLYPGSDSRQIRDSFIIDKAIAQFSESPEDLLPYLNKDDTIPTIQKMLTLTNQSYERVKDIATSLSATQAATLRSIIAYSVDRLEMAPLPAMTPVEAGERQLLKEKVRVLEMQLAAASETLSSITTLLNKEV